MNHSFNELNFIPAGFYSELVERYLQKDKQILELYPNSGFQADFGKQIADKAGFDPDKRRILADEILRQYGELADGSVLENIQSLRNSNTFTITTGQQIHIMLGPLYVIYKTLSAINLASKLSSEYPDSRFVPVFWMASEDHDFAEIDHFSVFNREFRWQSDQMGPVGRFTLKDLRPLIAEAGNTFAADTKVQAALTVFKEAYEKYENLADATRYLMHHFFAEDGLVVIDPDSAALKYGFKELILDELHGDKYSQAIKSRTETLKSLGIKGQISARNTNLFMTTASGRERVDRTEQGFQLNISSKVYHLNELEAMAEAEPEVFSPNVALRPLYQELILPNLAYIAGPGEFGYWCQLQPAFELAGIPAPVLVLRRSVIAADRATQDFLQKLGISEADMCQGLDHVKELYMNSLGKPDALIRMRDEVQRISEKINAELYRMKSPELKSLKKASDQYVKSLSGAIRELEEHLLDRPENSAVWKKLIKAHNRFFDAARPQERSTFFIEMMIQKPDFLQILKAIPESGKSPITLIWI